MTAKEYLQQYKELDKRIDVKLEQKERLLSRARYASPTGGARGGLPYDKVGELTAKVAGLERAINEDIDRLTELQAEITERIAALPDPVHRDVLEKRFINCWAVRKIAARQFCSEETVYKNQRAALRSFSERYGFSAT